MKRKPKVVKHCGMTYELIRICGEFAFIRCGTWCVCVPRSVLSPAASLSGAEIVRIGMRHAPEVTRFNKERLNNAGA